jgi:N-terminal domain of NWD NACHT-NTPase
MKPKDEKPSSRKRLFGKMPQQPDHDSRHTQIQPAAPSPLKNGEQPDPRNGAGAQRLHRRGFFSFLKSKSKDQNSGDSNQVSGSDIATTEPEDQKKLDPWIRAYAKLRRDNSTKRLVQVYEKILAYRIDPSRFKGEKPENIPDPFDGLDDEARIKKLSEMLQPVLKKYQEEKWWKTAAEGADEIISNIGTAVGTALAAYPPAALAWSGICVAVPVSFS